MSITWTRIMGKLMQLTRFSTKIRRLMADGAREDRLDFLFEIKYLKYL